MRYGTSLPVRFWYSEDIDDWQEARIIDISMEGLLLETQSELYLDSTLLFDFTPLLPETVESGLITAHVVWKEQAREKLFRYGIYFLVVEEQYQGILEDSDRDRNLIVEILSRLLYSGKARSKKRGK